MALWQNWSGTVRGVPSRWAAPGTEDELRHVVAASPRIAVVGSGHSFAPLVDPVGRTLISLSRYTGVESIDRDAMTATIRAGTRLDTLNELLAGEGLSLPNHTAIAEQTIAGATATASHGGSGRYGSLSSHVAAVRVVTADGNVRVVTEQDDEIDAVRLHLGCLGVVTAITVHVVPAFSVRKVVVRRSVRETLRDLPWLQEKEFGGCYWYPHTDEVRLWWAEKTGLPAEPSEPARGWNPSHRLMRASMWPVPLARIVNRVLANSPKQSVRNARSDHAVVGALAPRQQVLEYGVPASSAEAAFEGLIGLVKRRGLRIAPPVEVRFTAADTAWLSPAHGQPTCYFNVACYLGRNTDWRTPLRACAEHFAAHDGRSHWAKAHWHTHDQLAAQYPRWRDFLDLREKWDPEARFLGTYLAGLLTTSTQD